MYLLCWPFYGHGSAPVQYKAHCPMQHVQGYSGSHWTPPPGDYLLCIAPAAARATANKTTSKTYTYFAGRFDGRSGAPVQYCAHQLMDEVWGFGRSHWTLPSGKYCGRYLQSVTHMLFFFSFFIVNA
jgi:hypothetical protein